MSSSNPNLDALCRRLIGQFNRLIAWLRGKGFTQVVAEEAVGQAFAQLGAGLMPEDHPNPIGWLRLTARREALSMVVGKPGVIAVDLIDLLPADEDLSMRVEMLDILRWIEALTENQRKAVLLWAQGFTYAQVAEKLDWSMTQANRHINEGIAALRKLAGRG